MIRCSRTVRLSLNLIFICCFCGGTSVHGQLLMPTEQDLPGLWAGHAAWADFDRDGDLDLAVIGEAVDSGGEPEPIARVYENLGGGLLSEGGAGDDQLIGTFYGEVAWGDYDNDGYPDLAIAGWDATGSPGLRVYTNDEDIDGGRVFHLDPGHVDGGGPPVLTGVRYAALEWADYDGDGDLDLTVTGLEENGTSLTRLYANIDGRLQVDEGNSEMVVNLHNGDVAWGDYDNDGDLDLAVSGESVNSNGVLGNITELYRNEPTGFLILDQSITAPDAAVRGGDLAWCDYDADGNLDLAVSGRQSSWATVFELYRNRPMGVLTLDERFRLNLVSRIAGTMAWGDYDNDGYPDLAAAGRTILSDYQAHVFINDKGQLSGVSTETQLTGVAGGNAAWGDHDGDGDLDLLLSGVDRSGQRRTTLYDNQGTTNPNQPPCPPAARSTPVVTSNSALFRWSPGSDAETDGLTYNLRVGTEEGGGSIVSASTRPAPGNAGFSTSKRLLRSLAPDRYYWNVQSVDGAYDTSAWMSHDAILNVQQFVSSDQKIRPLSEAAMAWGDYDQDGDPDLVICGVNRSGVLQSLLYRNDDGSLAVDTGSELEPLRRGDAAWGDIDGDGYLDLLLTGTDAFEQRRAYLYRTEPNGSGHTLRQAAQFPNIGSSAADWGDYDGDGDLDLALTGQSDDVIDGRHPACTRVFVNRKELPFDPASLSLTGVQDGDVTWVDYDGDGDLDLALIGDTTAGESTFKLYRNDGGSMTPVATDVEGLSSSTMAWADYDGDGDPDLAVAGMSASGPVTRLYRNDGGEAFVLLADAGLPGVFGGDLVWGDYDNDQDHDLLITGNNGEQPVIHVYENTASGFQAEQIDILVGVDFSAVALVDYDADGDLDLVSAGRRMQGAQSVSFAAINDNLEAQYNANRAPEAPQPESGTVSADTVVLNWTPATDEFEQSPNSLTYSLRVGTARDGDDVVSGNVPVGPGNAGQSLSRTIHGLSSGTYYWSVRTVDDGFALSPWSRAESFIVDTVPPVVAESSVSRRRLGIDQNTTLAVTFHDEHTGVSTAVEPRVTAEMDGQAFPFETLQFAGSTWSGELKSTKTMPSGTAMIVVRGALDNEGNMMEPDTITVELELDMERPAIASSVPAAGAEEVTPGHIVAAITFTEALDPTAITAANFQLIQGGTELPQLTEPEYDAEAATVTIRPAVELSPGTEYTLQVGGDVCDVAGNRLVSAASWTFRTVVPELVSWAPADTVTAEKGTLEAVFSSPIDAGQLDGEAVQVLREGEAAGLGEGWPRLDGTGSKLTFALAGGLKPGSRYEVVLAGRLAGPLRQQEEGDFRWFFHTSVPELVERYPEGAASGTEQQIRAVFSGPVDAELLGPATVQLIREDEAVELTGAVDFDPATYELSMPVPGGLLPGSRYEVVLAGILAGPRHVQRAGDFRWRFETPVPALANTSPPAGASEVPGGGKIVTATFDKGLDDRDFNAASATVLASGRTLELAGAEYNPRTRTVRLELPGVMQAGTAYEVRMASVLGGPLRANDYSWRFSTAVPRLVSVVPDSGTVNVAADLEAAVVSFSVPLDEDQVVPGNFVLLAEGSATQLRPGDPLPLGDAQYAFAPAQGWQVGTRYAARIESAVRGPLGDTQPMTWSFQTEIPRVVSTRPLPDQDGVSTEGTGMRVVFSQAVARQDAALFELVATALDDSIAGQRLVKITAPSLRDSAGMSILSFAADGGLAPFTRYRVSVASEVLGPLATTGYSWSFSTAARLADADGGGWISNGSGSVELYFPPRAIQAGSEEVRVRTVSDTQRFVSPSGLRRITDVYEVSVDAPLAKPVTLTIGCRPERFVQGRANRLGIFRWNPASWARIGGLPVAGKTAVRTAVQEFGLFAVFEDSRTPTGQPAVRDLDCQPRAFAPTGRLGKAETDISFELGGPAGVTVRIYNVSGRVERVIVRDAPMAQGRISLSWDGRDGHGKMVSSGLYIVVVDAGGSRSEKTVAVVR